MSQPDYGQPDPQQTPGQPQYGYGQPDPQAAYGQQPSYGYQAPAEHPQSQMVFILGIVASS